ncbi:ketohexokinase isoform X2 [Lethenteron reissneri]|uniref:ketohexokinase isoform X2 n=1 Tax=Lethenteron reissneri TaxID=7753 RepID=UPI002AB6422D|nr:ketohexokinase isoform X2 [Lethenteron reissneri]
MSPRGRVLCVGLVCLDIISVVDSYPEEDTDTRCVSQRWQRGGNASNTCTVLSQLGVPCAFMGSLAAGRVADFVREELQASGVDAGLVVVHANCRAPPSSVVIANRRTGSRTILHSNRDLPEISADDFSKVDLGPFRWIHWEGRNGDEQVRMIARVNEMNGRRDPGEAITVSVEIEKPEKLDTHQLMGHGDVVFISKDFAKHAGYDSAEAAVRGLYGRVKRGAVLVCAWGEQGAAATGPGGEVARSPAFPPPTLVDTLGAGDTFIAGVIAALSRGQSLQEALTFGCRVAGKKCGVQGYEGLGELC